MKEQYAATFYENGVFHVYNRTNNREKLFATDENRHFFLQQFAKYLGPFVDTFCWCLLPNHFHFLVQIKTTAAVSEHLKKFDAAGLKPIEKRFLTNHAALGDVIELQWKRFFTSYAMAYNKQQGRKGNLFNRPFKRVAVNKDSYFTQAVIYIHANPLKHKLCSDFMVYKWSSWHSLLSGKPTLLCRDKVLDWFGGTARFIEIHKSESQFYYSSDIGIEDE